MQYSADQAITAIPSDSRLTAAIILGCLAGLGPLCTDLYLPALPQIAANLQTSATLVQVSLTATLLGAALGQIFIGPASDSYGRKKPLILSLCVFIFTSFWCAFAASIEELILCRFIQGLAAAGGIVLSRAIACDLYSGSELTKFFSLLMLINGIAPIASPIIGGQILAFSNWHGIFFILALFSVLLTFATLMLMKESLPPDRRNPASLTATFITFRHFAADRPFLGYVLVQGAIVAGLFAYIAGSPFVLQTLYGLSATEFSLCFALNGIGIMLFAQITAYATKYMTEKRLLACGLTLSLTASLLLVLASYLQAALLPLLLLLFIIISCIGITTTASFSLAIARQPQAAGSASGLLGVTAFICGALASPLVGLGTNTSALPLAAVVCTANLLALSAYCLLARQA